jgi:acetoin utilization deacetylase AcuC-like enzyme
VKVVYHPRFTKVYSGDPAAAAGRMESIRRELVGRFEFVQPKPAKIEDLKLVHSELHISSISHSWLQEGPSGQLSWL